MFPRKVKIIYTNKFLKNLSRNFYKNVQDSNLEFTISPKRTDNQALKTESKHCIH